MLTLLFATSSCQEEKKIDPKPDKTVNGRVEFQKSFVLGENPRDPYSLVNMTKAFFALKKEGLKGFRTSKAQLEATHLYVRFKAQNNEQLAILETDLNLDLYPYPLDNISVSTSKDSPYQYASVKIETKLPKDIPHQIIRKLFIPDKYDFSRVRIGNKNLSEEFIDDLVDKSLELTGNLSSAEKKEISSGQNLRKSKWRPSGRIQARDIYHQPHGTFSNIINIEGVKVRARRWYTTHRGITDANGNFSCDGRFRRAANYSILWSRADFKIVGSRTSLTTAIYNGPKTRGSWDLVITDSKQHQYAHVFRGAHHYYYKSILELRRPESNMVITARHLNDTRNPGLYNFTLNRKIEVKTAYQPSEFIYANIIHELAHSVHDTMGLGYHAVYNNVRESWAMGASYALTRMVYPNHKGSKPTTQLPAYTNVVVDMLDTQADADNNVNYGAGKGSAFDGDNVEGYTIKQIQDALHDQRTWNEWRDNIKNKYNNDTEQHLEELFRYWSL